MAWRTRRFLICEHSTPTSLSEYTKRTIPRGVEGRPFENKTTFEFEVDDYNENFLNQLLVSIKMIRGDIAKLDFSLH